MKKEEYFIKVLSILRSCTTKEQVMSCSRIMWTFYELYRDLMAYKALVSLGISKLKSI